MAIRLLDRCPHPCQRLVTLEGIPILAHRTPHLPTKKAKHQHNISISPPVAPLSNEVTYPQTPSNPPPTHTYAPIPTSHHLYIPSPTYIQPSTPHPHLPIPPTPHPKQTTPPPPITHPLQQTPSKARKNRKPVLSQKATKLSISLIPNSHVGAWRWFIVLGGRL